VGGEACENVLQAAGATSHSSIFVTRPHNHPELKSVASRPHSGSRAGHAFFAKAARWLLDTGVEGSALSRSRSSFSGWCCAATWGGHEFNQFISCRVTPAKGGRAA
jgi:hypothetical protein